MSEAQKNAVATHVDGAIEIRATLLSHAGGSPHRLDVHILDAEGVLEKLKAAGQSDLATTLTHLLNLGEAAAAGAANGHKIEITPENVGELLAAAPQPAKPKPAKKPKKKPASKKPRQAAGAVASTTGATAGAGEAGVSA